MHTSGQTGALLHTCAVIYLHIRTHKCTHNFIFYFSFECKLKLSCKKLLNNKALEKYIIISQPCIFSKENINFFMPINNFVFKVHIFKIFVKMFLQF